MDPLELISASSKRKAAALTIIVLVLLMIAICAFLAGLLWAAETKRDYHPYPITEVTAQNPTAWGHPLTHLQIQGYLTYVDHEEDGDWHLRLCDSPSIQGMDRQHCIVAECIPKLPCDVPKHGEEVLVRGIYRYDGEAGHRWAEVHPVEELEVVTPP